MNRNYLLEINIEGLTETQAHLLQLELSDIIRKHAPKANVLSLRTVNEKNREGK